MNNSELGRLLVTQLLEALVDPQVKAFIGSDHVRFEWSDDEVRRLAFVHIIRRGHSYSLSYSGGISHRKLETIHAAALGLTRRSYAIRSSVMGGGDPALQYVPVETGADAMAWCGSLAAHMKGEGAKWLHQPMSLDVLHRLFNATPATELAECSYLLSRAEKGVIIAKLIGDPALPELTTTYRTLLADEDIVLTYDDVCNWLCCHDIASLNQLSPANLVP